MALNSVTEQFLRQAREKDPNVKPDDLAGQLAADQRLAGNIQTDDLRGYLTGTVLFPAYVAYQASKVAGVDSLPPNVQPFIGAFAELEYILANLREIRTMDTTIASQMVQLVDGFKAGGLLTDPNADGFYALGGGRLYATPTPEEITALFSADDRETSDTTLVNRCVDALNAIKDLIRGSDPQPDHSALVKAFEVALG